MPESKPAITTAQLSPGMAACHARILTVAKHGTPEALAATLAGVLHRAEQSIGNAYDAALKSLREEKAAPSEATTNMAKDFREYLTVHPSIHLGGHEADDVARELAMLALDHQELAAEVPQFPMMFRKMWSSGEVQQWLFENMPAFATGMYTKGYQLGMAQRTSHLEAEVARLNGVIDAGKVGG